MSERDVLDDAIAALREETAERAAGGGARAAATRNALLLAAGTRRRRSVMVRIALPMVAVLAASTAWAAVTGRLMGFGAGEGEGAGARASASARASAGARASASASAEASATAEASASASASAAAAPSSTSASTSTSTSTSTSESGLEEARYRTAHQAHFVARDWGRALVGWEAYLAAYPTGRFAPEARYNRAIALLRLGRTDEARAALQPFADGAFGGYRQKEAAQLIEAVE